MLKSLARMDKPSRVLVCDDERHILRLIQVNLERQGYQVDCAVDGRQALRLLEDSLSKDELRYSHVIVDAELPFDDGYRLLTWIRTNSETRETWVCAMIDDRLRHEWERRPHHPDLYVSKPFNPVDLF